MAELLYPDAGQWISALQAGQQAGMSTRRQAAASQAGGLMASGDYKGAASALYGSGDITGGTAVASYGVKQAEADQSTARQQAVQQKIQTGDLAGAYAAAGTDSDLIGGLDKIASHAKETASLMASGLQALKGPDGQWLPPDVARQKYAAMKPLLAQRGVDAKLLDSFDPTPDSLNALQAQVIGLDKQLEMSKGVVVGKDVVNPYNGKFIYQGVDVQKVKNGDDSESLVAVGGPQTGDAPTPAGGSDLPRGLRNNNPLNVTALPHGQWDGQTGTDGQYATFSTPEAGWTAADKNLQSYARLHGINTIAGIVDRWAPAGSDGNDPAAYAATVSKQLGVAPNAPLNLADTGVRKGVLEAMAGVENGRSVGYGSGPPAAQQASKSGPGAHVIYTSQPAPTDDGALSDDAVNLLAGRYLKDGTLPPLGMGKTAAAARQKILNKATDIAKGLNLDAGDLIAGTADVKATASALNKMTTQIAQVQGFEDTALKNADLALSLAPKGAGPLNSPILNRWVQTGRRAVMGDPNVTSYDVALGTFLDEYAKIVSGATGSQGSTDASRREAYDRLSKYASQGQLQAGVDTMKQEMGNRVTSMEDVQSGLRAHLRGQGGSAESGAPAPPAGAQKPAGWSKALTPAQRQTAMRFKGATGPGGSQGNPFAPVSQPEFDGLQVGAWFINPADGRLLQKTH